MLAAINASKPMDALIEETVPAQIRLETPMNTCSAQ